MTIDEAIKDIKDNIKPVVGGKSLDMAIEALSCSEIPNNSDTISRRAAIDALKEKVFRNLTDEFYGAMQVLDELPSTQPDIIRCKDCAYCDSDVVDAPYGMTKKIFWCDRLYAGANENLIVEPDDFCSWAERRE